MTPGPESIAEAGALLEEADPGNSIKPVSLNESPPRSRGYLCLLTLLVFGLQFAWCIELSYGTPYLLSLGLSKTALSFIWIAGPLSGVIMQPLVGVWSDKLGRRKPFIIMGGFAVMVSLLVIAWTREIMQLFGAQSNSIVAAVAVVFIYILDFSINMIQAAARAFITDNVNLAQQDAANAWAGRMTGFGNVIGYSFGFADLPRRFPFLGDSQLKVLCWIACIALGASMFVSCTFITERLRPESRNPPSPNNLKEMVGKLVHSLFTLPEEILNICYCQFASWLGWFPFLFYMTTYVGEIYVRNLYAGAPHIPSHEESTQLWEEATRVGSLALLLYAFTSLVASFFLPLIVIPAFNSTDVGGDRYPFPWLTLRRAWCLSLVLFAVLMFSTFLVFVPSHAIILTALCGVSWSVTNWAPFALISGEISIDGPDSERREQAGIILGIHNSFVSAPQLLMSLISSLVFKLLSNGGDEDTHDDSIAWLLRIGGVCALAAAYLTTHVRDKADLFEQRRLA